MNIYIVPAWYPENEKDINASFFREQARALSNRGHQVTVIKINTITCKKMLFSKWYSKRFWQDGNVRVFFHDVVIPCPKHFGFLQERMIDKLYASIIDRHRREDKKRQEEPDLIHAHVSLDAGFHSVYAAKQNQLPLVVTEHYSGLLTDSIDNRDWNKVAYTIKNSEKFIFVGSNFQKKVCSQLNVHKKTFVIPNMVDVEKFKCTNVATTKFTVLCACYLKKHKSVNLIIEAFNQAFGKEENIQLVIAGDGEEKESLMKLVDRLGLNEKVTFKGRCSREQIADLFAQSHLFALTSKVEPFGVVYIEAIASGVPIIGTKGQGAEDIINSNNGILVNYGKITELGAAMKYVYDNYSLYKREKIREDCVNRFSEVSICQQIEKIYKNICG